MATHSSIFAWRIPCTEEPGGVTESQTQLTLLLGLVREVTVVLKFGESSGYCWGPAPADPGYSKERRKQVLCDNLEGWGGVRSERQVQEGDICILMADSRQCMAETNTTLSSNYPIKLKKKKNYQVCVWRVEC